MADESGSAKARALTLTHQMPYYQSLPKEFDIWEGTPQHAVLATVDGHDLFFFTSAYMLDARTPGGYLADDALCLGVIFFAVPHENRGRMNDNDFVVSGYDPYQYLKTTDMKISTSEGRVTYEIGDVTFGCRPPEWDASGIRGGVSFDLRMAGQGPTSFFMGDFDALTSGGRWASYDQLTTCAGEITAGGRRYEIEKGYGCQEHFVSMFDESLSLVDMMRDSPTSWFVGGNDRIQFQCTAPIAQAHVLVDGESMTFDDSGITIDVLESWQDPRNYVTLPVAWQITMRSERGVLDLRLGATGRANRMWAMRNGYILDVWMMGTADGTFVRPGGETIEITNLLFTSEVPRTVCP